MAELISTTEAKAWMRVDLSDDDTLIGELVRAARQYCEGETRRQFQTAPLVAYSDSFHDPFELPISPLQYISSVTYLDESNVSQTLTDTIYEEDTTSDPGQFRVSYDQTLPAVLGYPNSVTYNYNAGYASLVTFTNGTNIVTASQRTFTAGDQVKLWNTGGALPAELSSTTLYYIITVVGNTFQLSLTSGGAAVTFTDDGTGSTFIEDAAKPFAPELKTAILMLAAHWYEHREAYTEDRSLTEVPMAVKRILSHYAMPRIA